jgi:hypothetical protein
MVLKKSKHDFNTGNTLRSAALHQVTHKTQVTFWAKYLEYAQSQVQKMLDQIFRFSDDDGVSCGDVWTNHVHYLLALKATLETISYFPDCGVEFSLDKDRRWEILEDLEGINFKNLWPQMPKKDGSDVLPLEITYQKTINRQTIERSYCYYGEQEETGTGPHGNQLPYVSSQKRQAIYHNMHHRGIQRKAHLYREKKVKSRTQSFWGYTRKHGWVKTNSMPRAYLAEDNYRQNQETVYADR